MSGMFRPLKLIHIALGVLFLLVSTYFYFALFPSEQALLRNSTPTHSVGMDRPPLIPVDRAIGRDLISRLPSAFIPNQGQWKDRPGFFAQFGSMSAQLDEQGWWLGLNVLSGQKESPALSDVSKSRPITHGASLRMEFVGSNLAELVPEGQLAGRHNFFVGNDPAFWRTDVPRYEAVRYRGLYPGVEVLFYDKNGHLEYDLILAPGADLDLPVVQIDGASAPLRLDPDGHLIIETAAGPVRQPNPKSFQVHPNGIKEDISVSYKLIDSNRFGFVASAWNPDAMLVVDPGLIYSSFLGGLEPERITVLYVTPSGTIVVGGNTLSGDFPTTPGAWDTSFPPWSGLPLPQICFISLLDPKMPPAQQILYSTFLGSGRDELVDLFLDSAGVITVTGSTNSNLFPTTPNAFYSSYIGRQDVFIAQLDPRLPGPQQLVYSTFLGGTNADAASALSVDSGGVITVVGSTGSRDFRTTWGAWGSRFNGAWDAFLLRLNPRLPPPQQLVYSTFLGGSKQDHATSLYVDPAGVITVCGNTLSGDFPTTSNAYDRTFNSSSAGSDLFLARLDPRLPATQQLVYSTFLGGSSIDFPTSLAVDIAGVVTIGGYTFSSDFPTTTGAWNTTFNTLNPSYTSGFDSFIAQLDLRLPPSQQLTYSTFLGGFERDRISALSVDPMGVVTVGGSTRSNNFPTTLGAWDTTFKGISSAFVSRLDPSLPTAQQLVYSTFLGGSDGEDILALSVSGESVVTVAGSTSSSDFPTTPDAWARVFSINILGSAFSWDEGFIARLTMLPTGTRRFGACSNGCAGPLAINVTSMPRIGNATFQLTCNNAPPLMPGLLLLGSQGFTTPLRVLGVDLWIDPTGVLFATLQASSNHRGGAYLPLPLPAHPWLIGQRLTAQFVWAGPNAPVPCPPLGLSASDAIEITIQP